LRLAFIDQSLGGDTVDVRPIDRLRGLVEPGIGLGDLA